jgi:hypothetical protein
MAKEACPFGAWPESAGGKAIWGGDCSVGTTTAAIEGAVAEGLNAHIDLRKNSRNCDHEVKKSSYRQVAAVRRMPVI